jgi:hypothetical protein
MKANLLEMIVWTRNGAQPLRVSLFFCATVHVHSRTRHVSNFLFVFLMENERTLVVFVKTALLWLTEPVLFGFQLFVLLQKKLTNYGSFVFFWKKQLELLGIFGKTLSCLNDFGATGRVGVNTTRNTGGSFPRTM